MRDLERMVQNKAVALVGSASSLLDQGKASEIDAHDIVIRMNRSVPSVMGANRVGQKTDVWCMGRCFLGTHTPVGTKHILFMKLTASGDREWPIVQQRPVPATRWPEDLERRVHDFVGAPPGTGIRILWWLMHRATPLSVDVYGMDCWDTPSSWSGAPAPAHKPDLEKAAMQRLLEAM